MRIALKFEVNYSDRGCPLHEGIPYFIATGVCGYGLKCSLALQWDTGYYEEDNLVLFLGIITAAIVICRWILGTYS